MNTPWHLIDGYLDECLSHAEKEELRSWLRADREHARQFLRAVHDHHAIRTQFQDAKALSEVGLPEEVIPASALSRREESCSSNRDTVAKPSRSLRPDRIRIGIWDFFVRHRKAVAAAVGLAAVASAVGILKSAPAPLPEVSFGRGNSSRIERAETVTVKISRALRGSGFAPLAYCGDWLQRFVPTYGPGSTIIVGLGSTARLTYTNEPTGLVLKENSALKVLSARSGKRFELLSGTVEISAAPQPDGKPLRIVTRSGTVRVLGTALTVSTGGRSTRVTVAAGWVELRSRGTRASTEVAAGQIGVATGGGRPVAQTLRPITNHFGSGSILREHWLEVPGMGVSNLTASANFPGQPAGRELLSTFETKEGMPGLDQYGARFRGYLHPPLTGEYTFWVAADDAAELWLSTDEVPENKRLICQARSWSLSPHNWFQHPEQESAAIHLKSGRRYYIEALHKESGGGDFFAVAWQPPAAEIEVIRGVDLSPFTEELSQNGMLPK